MTRIVVVADDLSGAADTGVTFAERGYQTQVVWDLASPPQSDVVVYSTESRHSSRDQAIFKTQTAATLLSPLAKQAYIYKKMDSTLRGNPAAELTAMLDGFGLSKAIVAPAYPAQKRVTLSGIHYVDGIPVDQTSFGNEVSTANVRELFAECRAHGAVLSLGLDIIRGGNDALTKALRQSSAERSIFVADAETMDDLVALVKWAKSEGFRLFCGSAGCAGALAQTLERAHSVASTEVADYNGMGYLAVIASRREQTLSQIAYAGYAGIPVVCPDAMWFLNERDDADQWAAVVRQHLSTCGMALLTAHELPYMQGKSALICSRLADVVNRLMVHSPPNGLLLSGGDMVFAFCNTCGAKGIMLRGEVQPGIPWGFILGGDANGCAVVTKAGGFGDKTALVNALQFLRSVSI